MTEKNKKVLARGSYPQAVFIKALSGRRKPVTMGKNQSMFSTQPIDKSNLKNTTDNFNDM